MQNISPAKQLDDVLNYIVKTNVLVLDELLFDKFNNLTQKEIHEIVGKLASDNLIEIKTHVYEEKEYFSYDSTFKGRALLEAGGYVRKNTIDEKNAFNQLLNSRLVTFGAVFAGAYYLMEILRLYIVPLFQFACACKFVWQK
jgi:hypothetical protein